MKGRYNDFAVRWSKTVSSAREIKREYGRLRETTGIIFQKLSEFIWWGNCLINIQLRNKNILGYSFRLAYIHHAVNVITSIIFISYVMNIDDVL